MRTMTKLAASAALALSALAYAGSASAMTYISPWTGTPDTAVTLTFGDDKISDASGEGTYAGGATSADGTSSHVWDGATFTDTFSFTLPTGSVGFSGISIAFSALAALNFDSVTFNGVTLTRTNTPQGNGGNLAVFSSAVPLPVFAGGPQVLVVKGAGGANASWAGSGTFEPAAVPEPATWALMITGFGGAGVMLRSRRRQAFAA